MKIINKMQNQDKKILVFILTIILGLTNLIYGQQPLAGTDDIGRTLPQNIAVGNPKSNKTVALFYFLWQGDKYLTPTNFINYDLNDIVTNNSAVLNDFDHTDWGWTDNNYPVYYYGKSIYGYYRGDDYWVHLKNVQLLTDAGVDVLILDATNGAVYFEQADALMQAIEDVQAQGKNPPKVAFYTNSYPPGNGVSGAAMQIIYNNFYKSGAPYYHPNTWFTLDSKPLIIGVSSETTGKDYQNFYTYRESQWPTEAPKTNGWPWIEFTRPQRVYSNSNGQREIVCVAPAQHPGGRMGDAAFYGDTNSWGRSYREGSAGNPDTETPYGYNFQEQWDFAISQNVPFIFVTGWNELIVGRFPNESNPEHSSFVDGATPEYSRDIEPSLASNLKDNYYMQLAANIRKYKGIDTIPLLSDTTTIATLNDWSSVTPAYSDYTGDIINRSNASGLRVPNNILTISNHGFESPVIGSSPGYVYNPSGGSWTFSTLSGIVLNGGGFGNPDAVEGTQAAMIQQNGSFQQTFNFPANAEYTIQFSAAQRVGYEETFDVYCDSTKIGSWGSGNNLTNYNIYKFLFTTTAGYHTVKFIGTKATPDACFIDNIYIGSSYPVVYTNTTGRNDLDTLKIARNETNIYFYAKTVSSITSNSGDNWMNLYLDIDRNASTGWKGYDYRVIGGTQLQKWLSSAWSNTNTVSYQLNGNEMYYTIPKNFLEGLSDDINLEFKWSDNMQDDSDPLDWYVNGDAAPGARFNFIATNLSQEERMQGVYNGSFENPILSDSSYQYNPSAENWTYSATSGIARNGSAFNNPDAPEGIQCALIQNNSTIYQDVNISEGTYKLTFFAAQRPDGSQQSLVVTVDSNNVGTITPSSSSFNTYYTSSFSVTSGIHRITFTGNNTIGDTAFIDLIDLVEVDPPPATLSTGGFELPSLSPSTFQYNPSPNGWTYSALSGVARNGSALNNPNAPEGVQCGFMQGVSTVYQDVNFSAGNYKITFFAAQRPDGSQQSFDVTVGGINVGTITPTSSSFIAYSTPVFSVSAGIHRITFTGTDAVNSYTGFIDNVEIVSQPVALSTGGFELPSLSPSTFQYNPSPNGWTYSTYSGVARNGSAFNNPNAPEGLQCAFIQKNSEIYQEFNFDSGSYKIGFWAAIRSSNEQSINVYLDDILIGNIIPESSTNFHYYTTNSLNVTAGIHKIKFVGTDSVDQTAFIDNVAIVNGSNNSAKVESKLPKSTEDPDKHISIFPNPVSDIVNIKCINSNPTVELFTFDGRLIFRKESKESTVPIDVSNLLDGIYILSITDGNHHLNKRLVVLKN